MRRMLTAGLFYAAAMAAWDAASIWSSPHTFADGPYGLVFDIAPPSAVATVLAFHAAAFLTIALVRLVGRAVNDNVTTIVAYSYSFVLAVFGVAIFELGWTAGTGAWKWIGYAAGCVALGRLAYLEEAARSSAAAKSKAMTEKVFEVIDDSDMELCYRNCADGGTTDPVFVIGIALVAVLVAASEAVVIALLTTVVPLGFGAIGSLAMHWITKRTEEKKDETESERWEREHDLTLKQFQMDVISSAEARAKVQREEVAKLDDQIGEQREAIRALNDIIDNQSRQIRQQSQEIAAQASKLAEITVIVQHLVAAVEEVEPDHHAISEAHEALEGLVE